MSHTVSCPDCGAQMTNLIAEQRMAQYRLAKKRWLRQQKALALDSLGLAHSDPLIALVWDCRLNSQAALTMLELLMCLQVDVPEQADRITAVLGDLGIDMKGE